MSDMENLAKERAEEAQAGEFAGDTEEQMHDLVTADRDTNGISASMERLGDTSGVVYEEDMDEISVENHNDDGRPESVD